MKKIALSLLLAAAMLVSLAGCAKKETTEEPTVPSETEQTQQTEQPEQTEPTAAVYENDGMKLTVPAEYAGLVLVDVPQNDPDGDLFRVSEKASVEAGRLDHPGEDWGDGFLFGICRVSEADLHELLCWDMSGVEVFAKGADGSYYLYIHPTDVRFYRQGDAYQNEDGWKDWEALNAWAWNDVREAFLAENAGLAPFTRGNSMLDMYLARAAYQADANYNLITFTSDALAPNGVDAALYAERLMSGNGVVYEEADASETPAGAYIVLDFPDDEMRLDFFLSEGAENYVRQTDYNGESLLKITFPDDTKASAVVQEWFDAVAAANGIDSSLLGQWAEQIAGRGVITITASADGKYTVLVEWSSSAFEHDVWEMTATADADGALRYENGTRKTVTYTSETEYTEELHYENGTGVLSRNAEGQLVWQDDVDHAADDTVFIRAD